MNTMLKRIVSLVLCLVMVAGYVPVNAFADETGETVVTAAAEATTEPSVVELSDEATGVVAEEAAEAEENEEESLTADTGDPEEAVSEEETAAEEVPAEEETSEEVTSEEETSEEETSEEAAEEAADFELEGDSVDVPLLDAAGPIYVLAGSDFQADSGDAAGSANINNIISVIKGAGYSTMDGFLFAGDYSVGATKSSNVAALKNTIKAAYPELTDEKMVLIQGNHDNSASYGGAEAGLVGSVLNNSGANDAAGYGVYVINEKDYNWKGQNENLVKQTAADLDDYLDAKRNAGYTQPIFVVSHLPLNYNMRTKNDGDGMYANYIFDVLNEAGEAGLNIIFMFGHDHSNGWDDYLGGAAIYLEKGDKINIAQGSRTVFVEKTLAFTYMNAGYVGYYRNVNTGSETDLTMTVFEITADEVEINRFSQTAVHDLKSAGVTNSYKNETAYSPDTEVYVSPQTVTLNKTITPAGEEIEVPDSGNTGSGNTGSGNTGTGSGERTYTRVTSTSELVSGGKYLLIYNGSHFMLPEVVEKSDGSIRKGFNIESTSICGPNTITGDYEAKEWVLTSSGNGWLLGNGTKYAKLTNTTSYKITATLENSGDVFTIGGSENAFTFSNGTYVLNYNDRGLINGYGSKAAPFYIYRMTSAGSSGSGAGTSGGEWVTITAPTAGGTRYKYQLDTNGVDQNVEYLIVANGYAKALSKASGSDNAVDITLDGEYAYATSDSYGWTFTRYSPGVYYIRLNNSTYLGYNSGLTGTGTLPGKFNQQARYRWTVTSNNNGSYHIVRNEYNLRWSNTNGVFQASNSSEGPVRLYKYVTSETTQGLPGLYGKIDGELAYTVENGTSQEDALLAVKAGITGYTSANANGSSPVTLDDSALTWTFEDGYNPVQGGDYPVSITYNGVELGTAKVTVKSVGIAGYAVNPTEGSVEKGVPQSANTGATLTVTLENGKFYTVPVTVAMLSKADGSAVSTGVAGPQENLRVTYNGVVVEHHFTLEVTARTGNNYPEYPHEGSVKVNKTGTGIDFQSSGIAQVEISASGVPMKKGADVIVMLDLSSSMNSNKVTVNGVQKTRLQVLRESMTVLLNQLQANDSDGNPMDIRIAIADFNRYYTDSSSPYYINSADHPTGGSIRTNNSGTNQVYTGGRGLNANAFVDVHTIANNAFETTSTNNQYYLGYASGTNYDYAFDAIYQLGEAINTKNAAEGTERDLFVIFMSDGAPFQYNYFSSQSNGNGAAYWNNWLQGTMTDGMFANGSNRSYYNAAGKHWMAEAIKGVRGTAYDVIRKNNAADTDNDNWVKVNGLGAKMYSVGFCVAEDQDITAASMEAVIRSIATSEQYYYRANSAADLNNAFAAIGSDIAYAAYNARFVDQMGDDFNIQLATKNYTVVEGNKTVSKTVAPVIEILSYDIYTLDDQDAGTIPAGKNIGDRKGTKTLLEVVKFSADGSKAYSSLIDADKDGTNGVTVNADGTYTISDADDKENILVDGIIKATHFFYNTNSSDVSVTGVSIPTGKDSATNLTTGATDVLPAETFYWKMGTVQTDELAMRYYVYLDGSMEGTREGGSYPTNEYATLYYDNYLHNPCYKETVSPVMPWKEANVSYAFYLVDEEGNIIVNQTTGEIGTFANKIAVTNPVVYETIKLNNLDTISSIEVASTEEGVLPVGYELYDSSSVYTVRINSNTTGNWRIAKGSDKVNSTYVTQFDIDNASAYSNDLLNGIDANGNTVVTGNDYTHTVVWFAVLWKVQPLPDSVVIDYGLPVDISVLANDMFGENGKLAGVGAYSDNLNLNGRDTALAAGFGEQYTGTYGVAKADTVNGKVRYELNKTNGMQMSTYEKFAYAVNYTGNENAGYYYDTVTVIPATTIYYEDNFLTYESFTWDYTNNRWKTRETSLWSIEKTSENVDNSNATQDEDRPGKYALEDANNIYGYDNVNLNMTKYSLDSAAKATVDYDNYAQASFTFCGTGFDIISMTSNMTGLILVDVQKYENNQWTNFAKYTVDTYYGYKQAPGDADKDGVIADGELIWVVDPSADDSIYQVPVIKMANKAYGQYKVTIKATYEPTFDHVANSESYDFYLDAIRIYDPANDGAADGTTDKTVENAYVADGEGWPSYIELRNNLIADADKFNATVGGNTKVSGAVFIDGDADVKNNQIADYISYGPNNEVYLKSGQSVAFILDLPTNIANVHIGIKSADGNPCTYTIVNYAQNANSESGVAAGQKYHEKTSTVNTTTDMYYDLTSWRNDIIVISNTGSSGILSLTNIKSTYKSDPAGNVTQNVNETGDNENGIAPASFEEEFTGETRMYMTTNAAAYTLRTMNAPVEEEIPDPSVPETTIPPETTVPETTVPETTVPETTEPEETKPVKPDNSELKAAVEEARKIKQKGHTQASFKKLQTAIKAAEKVLKDKKATQAQIDKALADLNAAVDALETVEVKPIGPKPGTSGGKFENNFMGLDFIMNIFRNLLKGNKK